jgi:hypothetical protein
LNLDNYPREYLSGVQCLQGNTGRIVLVDEVIMKQKLISILAFILLAGCGRAELGSTALHEAQKPTAIPSLAGDAELSIYAFPKTFDPAAKYLFYLHGKIIEDQGIPAVSADYGEYDYKEILQKLVSHGFTVVSEQRPKNTDVAKYANRVFDQVTVLLNNGVSAGNITIIGASKGAGIAILVSHLLENEEINFIIMGTCHPTDLESLLQNDMVIYGNVLAIRDSVDKLSGSCQKLFEFSEGRGLSRHQEIVLYIGTGHGILYQPLDEWVLPAVQWAGG